MENTSVFPLIPQLRENLDRRIQINIALMPLDVIAISLPPSPSEDPSLNYQGSLLSVMGTDKFLTRFPSSFNNNNNNSTDKLQRRRRCVSLILSLLTPSVSLGSLHERILTPYVVILRLFTHLVICTGWRGRKRLENTGAKLTRTEVSPQGH